MTIFFFFFLFVQVNAWNTVNFLRAIRAHETLAHSELNLRIYITCVDAPIVLGELVKKMAALRTKFHLEISSQVQRHKQVPWSGEVVKCTHIQYTCVTQR